MSTVVGSIYRLLFSTNEHMLFVYSLFLSRIFMCRVFMSRIFSPPEFVDLAFESNVIAMSPAKAGMA